MSARAAGKSHGVRPRHIPRTRDSSRLPPNSVPRRRGAMRGIDRKLTVHPRQRRALPLCVASGHHCPQLLHGRSAPDMKFQRGLLLPSAWARAGQRAHAPTARSHVIAPARTPTCSRSAEARIWSRTPRHSHWIPAYDPPNPGINHPRSQRSSAFCAGKTWPATSIGGLSRIAEGRNLRREHTERCRGYCGPWLRLQLAARPQLLRRRQRDSLRTQDRGDRWRAQGGRRTTAPSRPLQVCQAHPVSDETLSRPAGADECPIAPSLHLVPDLRREGRAARDSVEVTYTAARQGNGRTHA